jgi:DNA-binding response OmpR family regulator
MERRKVLIADDNCGFLDELEETLALSGYDMIAVSDPVSILEKAIAIKPSLILLDLKMPKKSGFQVAKELKENPQTAGIPVIAMSAFFEEKYKSLLEASGIKKCLKKPFNPLDVIAQIEEAFEG